MDLTELTDMSDQELAEVFADSDEENHNGSRAGEACENLLFTISNRYKVIFVAVLHSTKVFEESPHSTS